MYRFLVLSLLLPLLAATAPQAATQEMGREWVTISKEQFKVEMATPHISDGVERYHRAQTPNYGYVYVGSWTGLGHGAAEALVIARELPPNYYIRFKKDLEEFIRGTEDGKTIAFKTEHASSNRLGRIEYVLYSAGAAECTGFHQYFGRLGAGSHRGVGTKSMIGYYCAPENSALTQETAEQVVRSLRWKD